jgi:ABC-type nickel/cobalt efflux system permease component RcnA
LFVCLFVCWLVGWLVGWSQCVLLFVGLVVGWLLANKQTNKHNDHTIKRAITESDKQHKQTNNTHIHTQTNTHTHKQTEQQTNKQTQHALIAQKLAGTFAICWVPQHVSSTHQRWLFSQQGHFP